MWVGVSFAVAILAVGLAIFAEVNRREAQTRDLAVTHMKLANAYLKDSQPSEARDAFKSARRGRTCGGSSRRQSVQAGPRLG
jgi:hypothetical protein